MSQNTNKPAWVDGALHKALVAALPAFVKDPFSTDPRLDVPRFHVALGVSNEAVYGWMRENRLRPRNVRRIVDFANANAANLAALTQLRRKPPKIEDFATFLFA